MKSKLFWLASLLALPAAAQTDLSTYQGPGVLSPGVGDIGSRSGQQVDLRFWGGVNALGQTNLQPLITDSKGNLIHVPTLLYGVEANIGASGVHSWQHAQLGVNYAGDYPISQATHLTTVRTRHWLSAIRFSTQAVSRSTCAGEVRRFRSRTDPSLPPRWPAGILAPFRSSTPA